MQNNLSTRAILSYDDVSKIPSGDSAEPLVDICTYDSLIIAQYNKDDMRPYLGDGIVVRDSLARKLSRINKRLMDRDGMRIKVVYGYRHPDVQTQYFEKRKADLKLANPTLSEEELVRLTHNFVAVPTVAGHPTGGAIDVTLMDSSKREIDMGTAIADYSDPEKVKTFTPCLTAKQIANRKLLHDAMVEEGLAPFYGEWWHFSYGDREWAAFYDKKTALYGAIDLNSQA